MTDLATIRARREAHEAELPQHEWFSPAELSARWKISATTVRETPIEELRYKEFGRGQKIKRRRYRGDWVRAYEEASGILVHATQGAA